MKKEYAKPEIQVSGEKKFEKVYAGGCSNVLGETGCGYGENWETGHAGDMSSPFWNVVSDHHSFTGGYNPGGSENTPSVSN